MLFIIVYVISLLLVCINIYELIIAKKLNNDLLFLITTNYLLNISTAIFFGYYNNIVLSLICSSLLLTFAIALLFSIKKAFNQFRIIFIPYIFLVFFTFFYILFNVI